MRIRYMQTDKSNKIYNWLHVGVEVNEGRTENDFQVIKNKKEPRNKISGMLKWRYETNVDYDLRLLMDMQVWNLGGRYHGYRYRFKSQQPYK